MRASGANAQSGRFVDAAVGFDDDKAAAAAIERHGHRIPEQRPAHEREPPSEPLERPERRQFGAVRPCLDSVACPDSDCRRRSLPNTVGTDQKGARSVDQPRWLRAEVALSASIATCIAPMIRREQRRS